MSQVWIVLEGPDMTYYGSAEIHGVYATEAEATARADALNGGETHDYDNIQVEAWAIGEESDRTSPPPPAPASPADLSVGYGLLVGAKFSNLLNSSPQTTELNRKPRHWWSR